MNSAQDRSQDEATELRWPRLAPIFTLIVLAPGIAEVLSGATRMSVIFVLVPEMMAWGCGALLIREAVRRWGGGWTSMLLMGLGLSIAEEFIIQQTSVAPLPFPGVNAAYGRMWGVNLDWFLYFLVYESVLVVLVPVQVSELIYWKRRERPWLKTSGMVISSVTFVLGSFLAWFLWIRIVRPNVFHVPYYPVPMTATLSGLGMIVLCIAAAYGARNVGKADATAARKSSALPPWAIFLVAVVFFVPWYALMALIFGPARDLAVWIPLAAGTAWALLALVVIRALAAAPGWGDMHRWALCFGATLVCMAGGFLGSSWWPRVDIVGKAILNVLAVVGFILLAQKIAQRATVQKSAASLAKQVYTE
jgi:hypothetical protein